MRESKRHITGMKLRRSVLGDAHVNAAEAGKNALTEEFQDLITRSMPGVKSGHVLDCPDTRSLLTIAMMVALNRREELRMHLRAAANNGVTKREIKEVLLQCAIYCGVPAAHSAFLDLVDVLGPPEDQGRRSPREK